MLVQEMATQRLAGRPGTPVVALNASLDGITGVAGVSR